MVRFPVQSYIAREVWSRFIERIYNTWLMAKKGWYMERAEIEKVIAEKTSNLDWIEKKAGADENHLGNALEFSEHDLRGEVAVLDPDTPVHVHKWQRGMLPGQKYVKQCKCGITQDVSVQEWQNLG